ncbi:MAG TPA: carboxypeptidase regulatory-like domain-containing protein, partial [Fluviicoccus sp.]|nr:carboxypeptidase regulatory-like domain-containing protein [Fluviicoccus sp.]
MNLTQGRRGAAVLTLLALLALAAQSAFAASLSGVVRQADGQPVAGVMLTVFNPEGDRKETVYTGRDGRYAIRTGFEGKLRVRARMHKMQDAVQEITAGGKALQADFVLQPYPDAATLSASLTASAHLTRLKWPDENARAAFVSQCNYCHQVGNALTRRPRDLSAWEQTVDRMQGYMALLTRGEAKAIVKTLHDGFDNRPMPAMQKYEAGDDLGRAKIREWLVGDGLSFIHDADFGPDGILYGTDEGHDLLWALDRRTGRIDKYPLPDINLPVGGHFSALQLPLGVFTGKHGPHSMAQGKNGLIWITNALSSVLMSFDTRTKQFKSYTIDEPALYLHTIRVDAKGIVWFTAAVSNKVGRFDPDTGKFTMIQLPHDGVMRAMVDTLFPTVLKLSAHWPGKNIPIAVSPHRFFEGRNLFNLPYGIDVNPKDGSIWYAKLLSNKIGRIDPKTLAVTEMDTPLRGPRRPRFDRDGVLWIPAFDDSALMRYDPAQGKFTTFRLPTLAPGEYETPYALNVHPKTGEVWITSNMSDRILRFNPRTQRFMAYPSPTRVTWLRDLVFSEDGQVCSSSSNLPAYGIEDGRDAFVCLDPEGGDK